MTSKRLGKGLGALFPSLGTKQTVAHVTNASHKVQKQQSTSEPANKLLGSPSSGLQSDDRPLDVKRAARALSQAAQTRPPLAYLRQNNETTAVSDVQTQRDASSRSTNNSNRSAEKNSRRKRDAIRMPGWDEIAHPVDMFFGGTDLAAENVSRETISPTQSQQRGDEEEKQQTSDRKESSASGKSGRITSKKASVEPDSTDENENSREGEDKISQPLNPIDGAYLTQISVDDIVPNPKQPRTVFDEDELQELTDSIKEVGVLQPIVVIKRSQSPFADDRVSTSSSDNKEEAENNSKDTSSAHYELVMGERRWRASQRAGLKVIPAIVRTATSEQMLRDALLENLQRVQLNPLEEAAAYQQMMQEFGLTQQRLSQAVSKSRPQIANTLRLLTLPAPVQKLVASGVITAGHARALLTLRSTKQMLQIADRIVKEGLSVRSTEELVAMQSGKDTTAKRKSTQRSTDYWAGTGIPARLEDRLQTKVAIRGNEDKGRIVITFASREDLTRLTDLLAGNSNDKSDGWV